jgi:methyl-accepting chemotaxis protein
MLEFLNARLSIGARLTLIGALFLAPIALLVFLFVRQSSTDIDFAQREIDGTAYLAQIWPGFLHAAASGAPDETPIAGRESYDAEFGTEASSKAYADAKELSAKLEAGKSFIGDVADKSNLTLDPDLDSFYAMDAATVRLPGIVAAALALKSAYQAPADKASRLVDIAFAVSHLETSTGDALASLESAMKNNAAGLTSHALGAQVDAMKEAANATLAKGKALLGGAAAPDLEASVSELVAKVGALWSPTNAELARLLQARIDGFQARLYENLAFAGVFVLAAIGMSLAIGRGLGRRLRAQLEVMDRLVAGDASRAVPYLGDSHETGAIARTLAAFKASVEERLALRSEKSLMAELAAERTANEAEREAARHAQLAALTEIAAGLRRLADGDLTEGLHDGLDGEFAAIRDDFNATLSELSATLSAVAHAIHANDAGIRQLRGAAEELARGAERQGDAVAGIDNSVREIVRAVDRSAEASTRTKDTITVAKVEAQRSLGVAQDAVDAIERIKASSEKISTIIGVIEEIAFQTNLLALNAGVEAARAGESGKGFAVVASEVRALAQRSAEAAQEIKDLILNSSEEVESGVELVKRAGAAFEMIKGQIGQIDDGIAAITGQTIDQGNIIKQFNMELSAIDQASQQNVAVSEETAAACNALSQESERLTAMIGRFRLPDEAPADVAAAA